MNRFPLCWVLATITAVSLIGTFDRPALYRGKVIRLADGSHYRLLAPDPHATSSWRVHVAETPDGPVIVSLDAEDLTAAERGEFPPFLMHRANDSLQR